MSTNPEDYPPERLVRFTYNIPDENVPLVHICLKRLDTHVDVEFDNSDDGQRRLGETMAALPGVVKHVRKEISIQQEVDAIDHDLFDLLGEDDSE